MTDDVPALQEQLRKLLNDEADALQLAIAMSQAAAPSRDLAEAMRRVDQIRAERTKIAHRLTELGKGSGDTAPGSL